MRREQLTKSIGKNLKQARKAKGLYQVDLAKRAGITVNHYARLERGESLPNVTTLEALSRALKIHSSDILPF